MLALQKRGEKLFPTGSKNSLLGQKAFSVIEQDKHGLGAALQMNQRIGDTLFERCLRGGQRWYSALSEDCCQRDIERIFRVTAPLDRQQRDPDRLIGGLCHLQEMPRQPVQFAGLADTHWPPQY